MTNKLKPWLRKINPQVSLQEFIYLTAGSALLAVGVAVFLAPADIAPGGVTGLAIITNEFTGFPVGSIMLVFNIPMLILGFVHLGRFKFLSRTVYVVLLYNLGADALTLWLPPYGITNDLLLNSLYSGVVGGIGSGLIYRAHGTSAGTGVLGRVFQLKTGVPLSQIYLFTDGGVIAILGLVFGWESALYSLISLFVWGLATDYTMEGPSVIRTAFIVTDHPLEVAQALAQRLGIGATSWPGRGMFTQAEHTVLFCTVSRPDMHGLKDTVSQTDPRAFVVIGQGHQATGGVLRHFTENNRLRAVNPKIEPAGPKTTLPHP